MARFVPMGALLTCLLAASACPSPQGVLERVEKLGGSSPQWHITFTPSGDVVHFEGTKDGVTVSRDLDADATCDELEEAAAVILRVRGGEIEQRAVRRRRVVTGPVPDKPSARTTPEVHLEGGLGPSLVVDGGGGVALGGVVFLQLRFSRFPAALGATLTGATQRSLPLGDGRVSWGRISVSIGPEIPLSVSSTNLDFWTHVISGPVFLSYGGTATVPGNLGVRAGARLGIRALEATHFFVGLSATAWILGPRPTLTGDRAAAVDLPWLDLDGVAGVSWGG